ncbi:DNA helicase Rep [Pseudoalteromonas luteoviolacea]|uniref:ATP-dependent DNA helicase Rep n=1 Tax=Pseudoalteromonas luteoviolacea H33 TaxID=1365251 RepID=A0A167DLX8_9GAMM|nr:DNA helicase Rep [Pseudoalteromonas luteoviolacea]KZN49016.1 ATP-dependent DNA helicase Rep [Pseudoalteromonas luteoviolacea H33]KZN74310.1 ATP-dependent DNA helicase Rep [Pseudoalteromonas luteoviolacea H33-S]MBQ4878522.1 DNA helicase Rep [Pseudoalteromonas luteoviolacea]MBQ4907677.1 DNA helicase Rep [Pseudoalteromonas luteoviolacea]MCF6438523.1 DNA helicase Rep [Pseudoalteromonas luteoviolacea]
MKLNPKQDEAVKYISGPCLVLAGAGSGKTRVITNKIAYLVQQCEYKARNIAAVTFTNKAAKEMRERVSQTLGKQDAKGLWISTFHTLGLNIIKKEVKTLGFKPGFSLFDDQDTNQLLSELTEKELEKDKDLLNLLKMQIGNWKNDLILPERAIREAREPQKALFAQLYARYQTQLRAYNALDFDDLIMIPTLLLGSSAEVRERWQNQFRYLLVDEYQDTNTSQYQLVKLLVGERARFTVVGDDDQSIYSWRGAKPQNLVLLSKDYPGLRLIKLEQNYRSAGRILKSANILIANNPHEFDKKLFSELGYGDPLRVIATRDEEHEAERVVAEIISHKFMKRTSYKDYAILYRGNHQARVFEKALMANRIPYKISGGMSFFARSEIKDIMAYLRLLVNQDDDNAFLRIVNTPRREIGPVTLEKLGSLANDKHISLFEACFDPELTQRLTGKGFNALAGFARWVVELSDRAVRGDTLEAVKDMIREINYETYLYESSTSAKAAEMRMKNVSELYRWISDMLTGDADNPPMTLSEVVTKLTLRDMLERNEEEDESDAVQLLTLHASKGLEYPHVFMVGMEEGLLPHQTSIDEDNVEEERRLAYVGITRAQQTLTMTYAKSRRQFGEQITPELSRFVQELPQDDLQFEGKKAVVSQSERMEKGQARVANLRAMLKR